MKIAIVNGAGNQKSKPSSYICTIEDILKLKTLLRERKIHIQFSIDFQSLMSTKRDTSYNSNGIFGALTGIKNSIICLNVTDVKPQAQTWPKMRTINQDTEMTELHAEYRPRKIKTELHNDNFQNYKKYNIPKAQLVIADIPYNLGVNAFASSTEWYIDGDNKNGESKKAGKPFFHTDVSFNIAEYMHFCSRMLKPEPKEKGKAPAMIVFCSFEQMPTVIKYGEQAGFKNNYPLFFIKNYSAQVLKANMKIVGATEHAVVLYRDKLPKFNNGKTDTEKGKMIFNWIEWQRDKKIEYPKIHPTQKPVAVLKRLIEIFTDEGDVVIDPCAGSGSTLRAAAELKRNSYGFEVAKNFYNDAIEKMLASIPVPEEEMQESLFLGGAV